MTYPILFRGYIFFRVSESFETTSTSNLISESTDYIETRRGRYQHLLPSKLPRVISWSVDGYFRGAPAGGLARRGTRFHPTVIGSIVTRVSW